MSPADHSPGTPVPAPGGAVCLSWALGKNPEGSVCLSGAPGRSVRLSRCIFGDSGGVCPSVQGTGGILGGPSVCPGHWDVSVRLSRCIFGNSGGFVRLSEALEGLCPSVQVHFWAHHPQISPPRIPSWTQDSNSSDDDGAGPKGETGVGDVPGVSPGCPRGPFFQPFGTIFWAILCPFLNPSLTTFTPFFLAISVTLFPGRRRCTSCGTVRTPMWRTAEGGTLLCNACGIRYRKYRVRCRRCWNIPGKSGTSPRCPQCPQCPTRPPGEGGDSEDATVAG
uniref:GATA-type domain-containing protein n=1 Tax=Zosterops lateralis melanops TaxID=1220523 RepID=A0A8D2PJP3_ZOSLA